MLSHVWHAELKSRFSGSSHASGMSEYDDPTLLKPTQWNFNEHDALHSETPHGNSIVVLILSRIPSTINEASSQMHGVSTHCPPKSATHIFPQATYLL